MEKFIKSGKLIFAAIFLSVLCLPAWAQDLNGSQANLSNLNGDLAGNLTANPQDSGALNPHPQFVLLNEGVLNDKVTQKLSQMGSELYQKTGIFVAIAASSQKSLEELEALKNSLKAPYTLLVLSTKSHKVNILNSNEVDKFFNKEEVLEHSVYPILGNAKASDIYNASMLNGYADIVETIAKYFNISLESSIGNANRDVLNILRILFYGFICFALLFYFTRRSKRRKVKFEEK